MQSRDGGWGAFDADNTRRSPTSCPFCDFGEVIDPPSADVTAHVVEMLAAEGRTARRAVPARRRLAARRAGARRLVVRPLGRQPRLRHRRGRPGPRRRRHADRRDPRSGGGPLARATPERRRRLGRGPPLVPRPGAGSAGASRPRRRRRGRCSPCSPRASTRRARSSAGVALPGRHPARRRQLGRAPGSPAPASPATSTSTTTSTGSSSRLGARPLPRADAPDDRNRQYAAARPSGSPLHDRLTADVVRTGRVSAGRPAAARLGSQSSSPASPVALGNGRPAGRRRGRDRGPRADAERACPSRVPAARGRAAPGRC